jgi:hypothetical protein
VALERALKEMKEEGKEVTSENAKPYIEKHDPSGVTDEAYEEADGVYKLLDENGVSPREYDDEIEDEENEEKQARDSAEEAQKEQAKEKEVA